MIMLLFLDSVSSGEGAMQCVCIQPHLTFDPPMVFGSIEEAHKFLDNYRCEMYLSGNRVVCEETISLMSRSYAYVACGEESQAKQLLEKYNIAVAA